ncbi:MAG TPA: carboxypeptidase-like regulatory domain-containing protein, partial [Gemmatimonadales bacterium]|nr:carboxypeptidase-like regulatory domain-containing protein [Gemmatimonadales bacterium]
APGVPPGPGRLVLSRVDGPEGQHVLLIGESWRGQVTLPAGSRWRVCPDVSRAWAACEVVAAESQGTEHRLRLWPVARIQASLVPASPERALPKEVEIELRSPPLPGRARTIPETTTKCPVSSEGEISCEVPALPLDLALRVPRHVPHYWWSVEITAGSARQLGKLKLEPGASLLAFAEVEDGELQPEKAAAVLRPMAAAGASSAVTSRLEQMELEAPVSARGAVQFTGIPPGEYLLEVRQRGWAPARAFPLEVWPESETRLNDPLVLRRPLDVELVIDPPLDWLERRWAVRVQRAADHSNNFDGPPVYVGTASADGRVVVHEQAPGIYLLNVSDSEGNSFFGKTNIRIAGPEDLPYRVELDIVYVEGSLRHRDEGVAGEVIFGGRHGAQRVKMAADLQGRFAGVLPHSGTWRVDVEGPDGLTTRLWAEVEPAEDGVAEVEIRLPDTEIHGRVVNGEGAPVPGAVVSASYDTLSSQARTQDDGSFRLRAFPPGPVALVARGARGHSSRQVVLDVQEKVPSGPLEMVLESTRAVRGVVVSERGSVPGAVVSLRNADPAGVPFADTATSGPDGSFTARMSEDAATVHAVVRPPGHALTVLSAPVTADPMRLQVAGDGGTLLLELPPEDAGHDFVALYRDGVRLSMAELSGWARGHGVHWRPGEEPLRIPNVAPGPYRFCVGRADTAARQVLETGSLGDLDCATGFLGPGATLILAPADQPPAPAATEYGAVPSGTPLEST